VIDVFHIGLQISKKNIVENRIVYELL